MRAVAQIAGEMRGHQDHRDIEHGHVDALALAGLLALEQRRRECERTAHARRIVDRRRSELDRVYVLRASHGHDAGGRLDDVVVGGLLAPRPGAAEGRERCVDQSRIDFR